MFAALTYVFAKRIPVVILSAINCVAAKDPDVKFVVTKLVIVD